MNNIIGTNESDDIGALLSQATCAVLSGSAIEGGGRVVGTAWLVTEDGYLLTAGHVVLGISSEGVWVNFPDEKSDRWATCVMDSSGEKLQAMYKTPEGIDFAVLKINSEESINRKPLPITLVSSVQGNVRACGYGSNLPNSQHTGAGVFLGPHLRNNSSDQLLFEYQSETLAVEGFSGAAIYSDVAKAVVGIQIAKERVREKTALAMPLSRVSKYWGELVLTARKPPVGSCVLLIPASRDEISRNDLINHIVRPVLDNLNLDLHVSNFGETDMTDLAKLEFADVVIADVSFNDFSVIYELTVAQGLGTPDIIFADSSTKSEEKSAEFNQNFKVEPVNLMDPEGARTALQNRLISVQAIFQALGESDSRNPITDYFSAPLTQISVANALALGYFNSFIYPVGRLLLTAIHDPSFNIVVDDKLLNTAQMERIKFTLLTAIHDPSFNIVVDDKLLNTAQMERIKFTIVLPTKLEWANDQFISKHITKPGLAGAATIKHPVLSRDRGMVVLPYDLVGDSAIQLADAFPTTLSAVSKAIDERLGVGKEAGGQAWRALESKEIDRFGSKVQQYIRRSGLESAYGVRLSDIFQVTTAELTFPSLK
ncbi:STING domain-containing protein [Kocuria sp. UCD-OTCP]|uniref:STING domain-containing protein n=1 Tax=Kocuria sp. UCD-OTCP TaxID=1292021 RepID=UPI0009D928F0|nr:STING domain-containing protein [Kocuria sp. UCD-OTCP]